MTSSEFIERLTQVTLNRESRDAPNMSSDDGLAEPRLREILHLIPLATARARRKH